MTDDPQRIQSLARFLPVFDRDEFSGGAWSKPEAEGGVVSLPFFVYDDDVSAFVQACYDHGWVLGDFDWAAFAETREAATLRDDPSALASATTDQLAKLLTIIIRQERFCEGALSSAIEGGLVRGILRRLNKLVLQENSKQKQNSNVAQVREVINRNTFVSLALAEGFNVFLPVYDGGVDFILYREMDGLIRKVQLKSRWTIDKKYLGRDIWVAFPVNGAAGQEWYLIPHDEMVRTADADGKTKTDAWAKSGLYVVGKPSKAMLAAFAPYRFRSIADVAAEAAADGDGST